MEKGQSIKELKQLYERLPIGLKTPPDMSPTLRTSLVRAFARDLFCEMTKNEREAITAFIEHIGKLKRAEMQMHVKLYKTIKH